jgi:hypothetical protein
MAKPSDGLEPSTPSLPCSDRQPVATHGNGFAGFSRFRIPPICRRLRQVRPLGSVSAPSSVYFSGSRRSPQRHVDAPLADAQSVRVEVNALGDAVEDGHLEVGVQLLLAREESAYICARRAMR